MKGFFKKNNRTPNSRTTTTTTGSGSTTTTASDDDPAGAPKVAVVKTMTTGDPTRIVVDADGMTVYEFRRDDPMLYEFRRDPAPTCYDVCEMAWAPLLTSGRPRASGGAEASMLGTVERRDGGLQVTYDGHPLYLYSGDSDNYSSACSNLYAEFESIERVFIVGFAVDDHQRAGRNQG